MTFTVTNLVYKRTLPITIFSIFIYSLASLREDVGLVLLLA